MSDRFDGGLASAATQARRAIHDNDVERLKQLLAEFPALLSWRADDDERGLLGMAASSYGDSFDPDREQVFTRAACAEVLLDAGAVVMPSVCDGLIESRARGLLQLFERKGRLPRTLKFLSALGHLEAVRHLLAENAGDLAEIANAFRTACRFEREAVASLLLDRAIALDPELGTQVDGQAGRPAFITCFIDNRPGYSPALGLWTLFLMERVNRAMTSHSGHVTRVTLPRGDGDLTTFVGLLQREPTLLGDAFVTFQADIIERATLNDRGAFIAALLDLDPAILRRQPPPPSQAIEFAFTYARPHLVPVLTRVWPLPDDLPHASGMGNLSRVNYWLAESGAATTQPRLDTALAWSVINSHFDVANVLLDHGADINTRWSSHEPASILHELVFHANYEAMQFVIDRGIDMTITDYRWNSTARGWALYAANDPKMAQWLDAAERRRNQGSSALQLPSS